MTAAITVRCSPARPPACWPRTALPPACTPRLEPTPALSWAVRYLGCGAGVCVTASHNPAKYNGYKVYGADGCQITLEAAEKILAAIEKN